jgi:MFS family permease
MYWRLWWANAISSTGDGAFVTALPLLAVTITRDPRLVSVVTAATYLPWLLLSLPAGAVVDRYDRATLMWAAQAVQAAVVTALVIAIVARRADIEVLAAGGLLLGSVYRMLGWGLMPVGALAGGFVAHAAGLRAPYIVAGLLCGLSVLAALPLLLPAARAQE